MSGKKGMVRSNPGQNTGRARMWRIMRRRLFFSIDNLVIPLDGVTTANARKYVQKLVCHGIVKFDRWSGKPGRPGSYKVFRLVLNPGPVQPTVCPRCKQPITTKICEVRHDQDARGTGGKG